MISVYRLSKKKYKKSVMDGEGARIYGGRWNSPGHRVVYASESRALAMLEILVHLEDEAALRESYLAYSISIPDDLILYLEGELPRGWRENPPDSVSQEIGDAWLTEASSLALAVPSVILPLEYNFLINPNHPDFNKLIIEEPQPIDVDPRLK